MELVVQFIFRGKLYFCRAFIDSSEYPCLLFVFLKEKELILRFGEEVTLKTDFETLLPKKDDYPALVELRRAIFDAVKYTSAFLAAKQKQRETK